MPTAYLLVGPSGSGKSTLVNRLCTERCYIVHPDSMRLQLTGDMSDQSMNQVIFTAAIPILIQALSNLSLDIVMDATNCTRKARAPLIKQLKDLGYHVEAHVFHVPIEECKRRNAGRARQVPDFVIDRQFAQWQEPALDEGMDAIIKVPFIPEPASL